MTAAVALVLALGAGKPTVPAPSSETPKRYLLEFTVLRDGKATPGPGLIVEAGKEGVVEVRPGPGASKGFQLRALAQEAEHPRKQPGRWVQVSVEYRELVGSEWKVVAQPWLFAPLEAEGAARPAEADLPAVSVQDRSGGSSLEIALFATSVSEAGLKARAAACGASPDARAAGANTP